MLAVGVDGASGSTHEFLRLGLVYDAKGLFFVSFEQRKDAAGESFLFGRGIDILYFFFHYLRLPDAKVKEKE